MMTCPEALRVADYYAGLVATKKLVPSRATEALIVLADFHALDQARVHEAERIVGAMDVQLSRAIALGRVVAV